MWRDAEHSLARTGFAVFSEPITLPHLIEARAVVNFNTDPGWGYGLDVSGVNVQAPQPSIDIDRATLDANPSIEPGAQIEIRQRLYRIAADPEPLDGGLVRIPLVELETQWRR
jgi:hypothetical protein